MSESISDIGLLHYLAAALLMFLFGIVGIIISRNLLRIIMSMLIISVSIILNFAAFGSFCDTSLAGANIMCLFVILIFAVQTGAALAVFFRIYRTNEYLDIEKMKDREVR